MSLLKNKLYLTHESHFGLQAHFVATHCAGALKHQPLTLRRRSEALSATLYSNKLRYCIQYTVAQAHCSITLRRRTETSAINTAQAFWGIVRKTLQPQIEVLYTLLHRHTVALSRQFNVRALFIIPHKCSAESHYLRYCACACGVCRHITQAYCCVQPAVQ